MSGRIWVQMGLNEFTGRGKKDGLKWEGVQQLKKGI